MIDGHQIRKFLNATGINQARFAELTGVTQPTVSRWLKGSIPDHAQQAAIQQVFDAYPKSLDILDDQATNVDEVRTRLQLAIKNNQTTAAALSRKIGRSVSYLSDFFQGKKRTLAAAESAALERALGLLAGSLLVSVRDAPNGLSPIESATPSPQPSEPSHSPTPQSSSLGTALTGTSRIEEDTQVPGLQFGFALLDAIHRRNLSASSLEQRRVLVEEFLKKFQAEKRSQDVLSEIEAAQTLPKADGHKDHKQ